MLFVRAGKLTGNQAYSFDDLELSDDEVCRAVLTQFYQGDRPIPDAILLPVALEDAEVRAEYLSERRGRQVEILVPQRGAKLRLVEMARENARHSFAERRDLGTHVASACSRSCSGGCCSAARPSASSASTSRTSRGTSRSGRW